MWEYYDEEFYMYLYGDEVGIVGKDLSESEKDREQDEKIARNASRIAEIAAEDQRQQIDIEELKRQMLENIALDEQQQAEIDDNKRHIDENTELDEQQQSEIDENKRQLDENTELDERQQTEINSNTDRIINVEGELTDFSVDGTTFVITKRNED